MIELDIKGIELKFETDATSFSPACIDAGTLAMLSVVDFTPSDKVLDLGCGYGVVGILAAKSGCSDIVMSDIDEKSVALSQRNIALNDVKNASVYKSDGFRELDQKDFTLILSNPPYHTDFSIAKHFIEKGFNRLCIGGKMVMVTKRKEWYKNKLISIFGGMQIQEINGYFVFTAEKRSSSYANMQRAK